MVPLLIDSNAEFSSFRVKHLEHGDGDADVWLNILMHKECPGSVDAPNLHHSLLNTDTGSCILKPVQVDRGKACLPDQSLPTPSNRDWKPFQEALASNGRLENETDYTATFFLEKDKQSNMDGGIPDTHSCKASVDQLKKDAQTLVENSVEEGFTEFGTEEAENLVPLGKLAAHGKGLAYCLDSRKSVKINLEKEQGIKKAETKPNHLVDECPSPPKQLAKSSRKLKGLYQNLPSQRVLVESLEYKKLLSLPNKRIHVKVLRNFLL